MGAATIECVVILDADELRRQFDAGIRCGMKVWEGKVPPEVSPEEFQEAMKIAFMAVRRDCQAAANHIIYSVGYGHGLKSKP